MARLSSLLVVAVCLAMAPSAAARDVVAPEVRSAMDQASAGEQLDVYLVMSSQLRLEDFADQTRGLSARGKRPIVATRLKAHAAQSQASARAILDAAVEAGTASHVQLLWMGNAIVFSARPNVIERLAELPGVDRIRLEVSEGPAAYQDVAPPPPAAPLPAPAAPMLGTTTYPFADDFETGSLGPAWSTNTTGDGYISVTGAEGPNGLFHVVTASAVDGTDSLTNMTVTMDLTGQTDVGIRFLHKEFSDEDHVEDGVFVSPDGSSWFLALSLQGFSSTYATRAIELDDVLVTHGITYTSTFSIRFQWRDNFDLPTDGFAFDDIEIAPGVGEPPPAVPEPNIIALQAPDLWDIGVDGAGVLIGNIDSGVWYQHPDLAERIWVNPGEIAGNLVDDDLNGFVDDIHGWDWLTPSSDPSSAFDSHGTLAAGIAVGDGTNGIATGMAPGATMIACQIDSEADYWLAQQYCLDQGVDVITSSYSYKWPTPRPDYHMHRQMCVAELAAGIIHANSIGNQGQSQTSYPIPFNVSTPGNCPSPFEHPQQVSGGGRTSIMACGGITLPSDFLYSSGGVGPSAWEDLLLYDAAYPWTQDSAWWEFPYGGFGGAGPGLLKPDMVGYTTGINSTTIGTGYGTFGGTSAATPHLGGALCLLVQSQVFAQPRHIAAALELSAFDLGPAGKDVNYGSGKIQVFDAARRLRVITVTDNEAPSVGGGFALDVYGAPDAFTFGWVGVAIQDGASDFNLVAPWFDLGLFSLDGFGHLNVPLVIPANPGLVGLTAWFQFGTQVDDPGVWGLGPLISVPEAIRIQP